MDSQVWAQKFGGDAMQKGKRKPQGLTDSQVAKALGYVRQRCAGLIKGPRWRWMLPGSKTWTWEYPPNFTTDLNAIVGEIERRGLKYQIGKPIYDPSANYIGWIWKNVNGRRRHAGASTAPLALCHALMALIR